MFYSFLTEKIGGVHSDKKNAGIDDFYIDAYDGML